MACYMRDGSMPVSSKPYLPLHPHHTSFILHPEHYLFRATPSSVESQLVIDNNRAQHSVLEASHLCLGVVVHKGLQSGTDN